MKKCPVEEFNLKDFDDAPNKVVLIGYPNAGKTSLFNRICSKKAKIVNYPGSTFSLNVAKSSHYVVVDSPGTRSLEADSLDEEITIQSLEDATSAVLVLNGNRLSTQLSLAYDLLKKQIPLSVVISRKDQINQSIDVKRLSEYLCLNVFHINTRNPEITIQDLVASAKIPTAQLPESLEQFKAAILTMVDAKDENQSSSEDNFQLFGIADQVSLSGVFSLSKPAKKEFDLDVIFLHPFFGPISFIGVMSLFFYCIYTLASPLIDAVDGFFAFSGGFFHQLFGSNLLIDLLVDGLWTGVGAVLVFTPQILILFFAIGLLEQSGYLVRAAMIIDRPLSKIGLNGRSFVPILSGCACAIPALLATRNIPDKKVRLICQFIIPLMQCSARLPVYGLLLGILFINQPWMSGIGLTLIYLLSFLVAAVIAGVTSKILKLTEEDNTFQLELPSWKMPNLNEVLLQSFRQTSHFIKRAGPIIAVLSILIWLASSYPSADHSFAMALGKVLEPIFLPMGVDWRVGVALLLSFVAREVFVSVLAIMFTLTTEVPVDMIGSISNAVFENSNDLIFTPLTSVSLMIFFMISMQCMATLATARQEMGNWKIPIIQLVVYVLLAYILAVLIQQIGLLFV